MKNEKSIIICTTIFFVLIISCNTKQNKDNKDITAHKTATVGEQIWSVENLNTAYYRNGDPILEAKTKAEWEACYKSEEGAWCYYENKISHGEKYGKLYNWYAVNDSRGLAPMGMHIPTRKEWHLLVSNLGGETQAFENMKSPTGFAAFPGGERWFEDCLFYKIGEIGFWWSSTKEDKFNAWYQAMHFGYSQVGSDKGGMNTGFSVRCIKD
ncbi:MAG: fibrobacter succinogenes major paralogous domain-containing protein [Desulfobacteraceae bacterium]|nr:fibrobacter succinogenes major paralogous domain-containing protein [Desulfobacteraceae bacterium]